MTTAEHRARIDAAALNLWLVLRRAAGVPLSKADLELFSSVTQHPAIQNTLIGAVEQSARVDEFDKLQSKLNAQAAEQRAAALADMQQTP